MTLMRTASPVEVLWTATTLIGLLAHLGGLSIALRDELARRRARVNGARQIAATTAIVHAAGRLLIAALYLGGGVIALLTPERDEPVERAGVQLIMVALVIGNAILTALGIYDLEARRQLLAALARRRAVIDAQLDGIICMDDEGRVVSFNAGAERLWGWRAADVVGQPVATLLPERFRAAHEAGYKRYLATGATTILGHTIRVPLLHLDGTERLVQLTLAEQPGPDGTRFVATVKESV